MIHNTQITFYSRVSAFLFFVGIGICSFVTMRQSGLAAASGQSLASLKEMPAEPEPDSRYKADILLIVAHPDDEQWVTGYLARAIYDEHKRVAVLWCTRGDGGRDAAGPALGAEREIEARRAVASLGIVNVWFIGAPDTPSQNVLWSLERWNHGAALEEAVRIVRLTRPEVIISLLPDYVTGENHGDHQAAGVIATEAFDMAGDPTKFPEQIASARIESPIFNTEGLSPWQPEKIYYVSDIGDTARRGFLKGQGPAYSTTDVSPSRHVLYSQLSATSLSSHMTQGKGAAAKEAHLERFERPVQLIFGKSLVGGSMAGEVFEGVVPGPVPFAPVPGYQPKTDSGMSVELGGSFAFYREFWAAHNIDRLANLIPVPEMGINPGGELPVPLLIHNYTNEPTLVNLTVELPPSWIEHAGSARYPVQAHGVYPVHVVLIAPSQGASELQQITWHAQSVGQEIGSVTIMVDERHPGMPQ